MQIDETELKVEKESLHLGIWWVGRSLGRSKEKEMGIGFCSIIIWTEFTERVSPWPHETFFFQIIPQGNNSEGEVEKNIFLERWIRVGFWIGDALQWDEEFLGHRLLKDRGFGFSSG